MELKMMSRKDRKPICINCEFGYPIELIPDMKELEYRCPLCGYAISFKDWNNLEERPYLEKYFGAKAGIPTEHRLRAVRLLHDITSGRHGTMEIHAEGSLAAQQMMNFFAADWDLYKASAKKRAGIPGWEKHEYFGKLPDYGDLVESKMPPVDESYDV